MLLPLIFTLKWLKYCFCWVENYQTHKKILLFELTRIDKNWQELTRIDKNWQELTRILKSIEKYHKVLGSIEKYWKSIEKHWKLFGKVWKRSWKGLKRFYKNKMFDSRSWTELILSLVIFHTRPFASKMDIIQLIRKNNLIVLTFEGNIFNERYHSKYLFFGRHSVIYDLTSAHFFPGRYCQNLTTLRSLINVQCTLI